MKVSRGFGCTLSLLMLSHVFGPLRLSNRMARAVDVFGLLHSSRVCRADLGAVPHSQGVGGFSGFESTAVREACRRAMALADRLLRLAVGANGFRLGLVWSL